MKEQLEPSTSRRDFLRENLKKAGYITPLVVVFSLGSLDAWAKEYKKEKKKNKENGSG